MRLHGRARSPIFAAHDGEFQALSAASTIVASVPATIEFSPPYAVRYGGIGLASKLGLRLYVGLEPVATDGPSLGAVRYYRPERDAFVPLVEDRHADLQARIANVLESYAGGEFKQPLRIHVLSEYPFFRGLSADSGLATALAVALHIHTAKIKPDEIEELDLLPSSALLKDTRFMSLYRLAWVIESALTDYRPEGHHTFASLVHTPHPVVFWRHSENAPKEPNLNEDPFMLAPSGRRLAELFGGAVEPEGDISSQGQPAMTSGGGHRTSPHDPTASLDAALVFIGREVDSQQVYKAHRANFRRVLNERYTRAIKSLRASAESAGAATRPRFMEIGQARRDRDGGGTAANGIMDLLVFESGLTFEALSRIAGGGMASGPLRDFTQMVGHGQDLYRLLDLSSGYADEAAHVLRTITKQLTRQKVAVRLVGAGRAGCLMVLAARGSLEFVLPTIAKTVQEALDPMGKDMVHCHWFSGREGYSPDGEAVRVEQHPPTGRYLDADADRTLAIREWIEGSARPVRFSNRRDWEAERKDYHLVLEAFEERTVRQHDQPLKMTGAVPKQMLLLLEVLLGAAVTGSRAVEVPGAEIKKALEAGDYEVAKLSGTYVDSKILKKIRDAVPGTFDITFVEVGSKSKSSDFMIRLTPRNEVRVALVRRRPGLLPTSSK